MKKFISFGLLLAVIISLVVFASCAKRPPDPDEHPVAEEPLVEEPMEISDAEKAEIEAEMERQRRIAEEEIEEYRAREKEKEAKAVEEEKEQFVEKNVYFAFDDSSLSEDARETLLSQARWLKENGDMTVVVEGHCDNRGTEEYNLALGSRRAQSVKDFLVNAGVESSRIITISYGEERPAVRGNNEEAWAKNRRAEFRLR